MMSREFRAHVRRVQHGIVCDLCARPHVGPFIEFNSTFCYETCWRMYAGRKWKEWICESDGIFGLDGQQWVLAKTRECQHALIFMPRNKAIKMQLRKMGRIIPVSEQRQMVVN
mgnify:CR=1 FL=1